MEVIHRRRADCGPIGSRMHVRDVGSERDMHGGRNTAPIRGREDAGGAKLEPGAIDLATHDFAQPLVLVSRQTRCAVQEGTGLFGHTKTAIGEAGPDIFGSAARQSHFIVVNDGCAVGRVGPDNTVAQEPADDRAQPDLNRMGTGHHQEGAARAMCPGDCTRKRAQVACGENIGQPFKETAYRGAGPDGRRKLTSVHDSRKRRKLAGTRARGVDRGCLHPQFTLTYGPVRFVASSYRNLSPTTSAGRPGVLVAGAALTSWVRKGKGGEA